MTDAALPDVDARRSLRLHLLSGLQRGAEAGLVEGVSYRVGSADDGDIVLLDETVAPNHLTLKVQDGQLRLEAAAGAVAIGRQLLAPGEVLELPTEPVTIRLGELLLGIGPEATDWAQVPLPAETFADSAVQPQPQPQPDAAPVSSAAADSAMMPNGMVAVAPAGSGVAPPEPPLEPPAVPPAEAGPGGVAGPRGRGIPRERKTLVIAAIAGVAALCLVLFLPLVRWKPVRPVSVAGLLPADSPAVTAAHQLLADWKLGAVQVAPAADGGVILTGYCETQELKERLSAALRARGLAVDNRVWPEDRLRQALAETLMRLGGPSLGYSYLGQGVVRLDGFVPPTLGRDDLLFTLRNDVPGIVRVEAAFRTLDDYLTELRGRVDQAGLTGLVTITADGSQVRAQGTLDDAQRVRWGLVAQSFHTANPAGPPLEDQVKPRPAPDAPAPAAEPLVTGIGLQGVIISADQPSRALLSDGTIVAVGDRIDARSRVQQIQFDQMVLSNGLQEQVIRLGAFNK